VFFSSVLSRVSRSGDGSLCSMHMLNSWLKYFREYWYIGSTSASVATTKYITEPRVATLRYFSLAVEIWSSVCCASARRLEICAEVACGGVEGVAGEEQRGRGGNGRRRVRRRVRRREEGQEEGGGAGGERRGRGGKRGRGREGGGAGRGKKGRRRRRGRRRGRGKRRGEGREEGRGAGGG